MHQTFGKLFDGMGGKFSFAGLGCGVHFDELIAHVTSRLHDLPAQSQANTAVFNAAWNQTFVGEGSFASFFPRMDRANVVSIQGAPADEPLPAQQPSQGGPQEFTILVQFDPTATAAQKLAAIGAAGGQYVETVRAAGERGGELVLIKLGSEQAAESVIAALERNPAVTFAEQNWSVGVEFVPADPSYTNGSLWGMYGNQTSPGNQYGSQAGEAWAGNSTGSTKVVIGVIDTGIDYTHRDLYLNIWLNQGEIPTAFRDGAGTDLVDIDADGLITFRDLNHASNSSFVSDLNANGRIDAGDLLRDSRWEDGADQDGNGYVDDLIGWDFVNNDNDPYDDNGHGTHVAGTIGATADGTGVIGVSPNVQLMALKFLSSSGSGSTSGAIKAVDYYTAASARSSPLDDFVATNNSWGGGGYSQALYESIVSGARNDILFVAAAGNSAKNTDSSANYPSNYSTLSAVGYEAVISVAAITSTGALASYSNYGSRTVDLGAPGSGILSTVPGGGYASYNGTSMATPHVAGALALLAAYNSSLTAAQLRDVLLSNTVATSSLGGKTVTGGRLDVDSMIDSVAPAGPTFAISADPVSVSEGDSGQTAVTFTVTLSQAQSGPVSVNWAAAGSGSNPASLTNDVGGGSSGTVQFAAGEVSKQITLYVLGDTAREGNEQFTVTLSNPSAGTQIATPSASVTIVNDDDDYTDTAGTSGAVTVDGAASGGVIDFAGDRDAFKVSLTAGLTYVFSLNATGGLNPFLALHDPNFTLITSNDDTNGTNSQITFRPAVSGDYYLVASGNSSSTGGYTLSAVSDTSITGTANADTLNGTSGDDVIYGLGGDDVLNGLGGNDQISGGDGNDTIDGGTGNDTIDGGNGTDTASYAGIAGAVIVSLAVSGAQNTSSAGTDTLIGIENITGGGGNDTLTGSGGANVLNGASGNDRLTGGSGRDVLIGGPGADIFDFNTAGETGNSESTADFIMDFTKGTDLIDLSTIDASSRLSGNNTFQWNGSAAITTSSSGELRYQKFDNAGTDNDYTMIYGDTDRDSTPEFQIKVAGLLDFTASDFLL